jgi:hypothetical protein
MQDAEKRGGRMAESQIRTTIPARRITSEEQLKEAMMAEKPEPEPKDEQRALESTPARTDDAQSVLEAMITDPDPDGQILIPHADFAAALARRFDVSPDELTYDHWNWAHEFLRRKYSSRVKLVIPPRRRRTFSASDSANDVSAANIVQTPASTAAVPTAAPAVVEKSRKGDATLIDGTDAVNFQIAEQYLGIEERQRQSLIKLGTLEVVGGANRKITTKSLRKYLPP